MSHSDNDTADAPTPEQDDETDSEAAAAEQSPQDENSPGDSDSSPATDTDDSSEEAAVSENSADTDSDGEAEQDGAAADAPAHDEESATDDDSEADEDAQSDVAERPVREFTASIEARHLSQVVGLARALVDEARVHLDSETGLSLRAVDPANVGMIDLVLAPDAFASFSTSGGRLGINLERFDDILSLASADDLVQLALDAETRKLTVQIEGLEYTLALIDPDTIRQEPDLPDLDLPVHITIDYLQQRESPALPVRGECSDVCRNRGPNRAGVNRVRSAEIPSYSCRS